MPYDDKPEFNDYIDGLYNEITIGDFRRLSSMVLFEMDEIAYLTLYNQYLNDQKQSLLEERRIAENFPAPIAFYYDRALHGSDNSHQRLQFLISTWEAIIFFLYALVVGEIIDSSLNISSITVFNKPVKCDKDGMLSDKLGYKLEIIEKILKFNLQGDYGLIAGNIIPISIVDILKELKNARNSFAHSAALSEAQSEERFEDLHPKLQDLLFELRNLEHLSLLRYKSNSTPITRISFSKYKGCSLRGKNYKKEVDEAFIIKNMANLRTEYLFCEFEKYDKIICLSPFACTIEYNRHPHIAWYKKVNNSTHKYSFEIVGDSPVEVNLACNTFDKLIQALKALL